jgi:hypothetical protein
MRTTFLQVFRMSGMRDVQKIFKQIIFEKLECYFWMSDIDQRFDKCVTPHF